MTKTGPLTGKTALITAADTGIGKSIAKTLAAQGAQVVIQHPHAPESAADVVKEITHAGGAALALAADLGDRAEYEELIQALLAACGHWDVLVQTTATTITAPLREVSEEDFDLGFAVPAKAVFYGIQLAAAHLSDGGRIITVANAASSGNAVGNAAVGAIAEFTRLLATDFAARRIAVNAVSPGTDGPEANSAEKTEHEPSYAVKPEFLDRINASTEITEVVALLVSDEAEAVTAQHLRVVGRTA